MPKRTIDVSTAYAFSYELWAGRRDSIVHAVSTVSKERISIILPKDRVEKIAREIDAGRQPHIVVSAVVYESAEAARGGV